MEYAGFEMSIMKQILNFEEDCFEFYGSSAGEAHFLKLMWACCQTEVKYFLNFLYLIQNKNLIKIPVIKFKKLINFLNNTPKIN